MGVIRGDRLDVWSYRAMWGAACAGSQRLADAGIQAGDRVGILGETEPIWGVVELALFHRGAVAVPLDPNHPDKVLRSILADAGAVGLLVSNRQQERARALIGEGRVIAFDELVDRERDTGRDTPPAEVQPDHPRLLVYTSGTTGDPKGVTLTDGNLAAQLQSILAVVPVTGDDTLLSVLPLNHVYAQIVNLIGPLYVGAAVRFAEDSTPQAVRVALQYGGVTAFGAVPQFFALFRDRVASELRARGTWAVRAYNLLIALSRTTRRLTGLNPGSRLFPAIHRAFGGKLRWVISGGSHLDPDLGRQYLDWGFDMLNAYGLTEATAAITVTPPGDVDLATVGRPLPGFEVRIDRPNADGIGEFVARGASVMPGYWNRPDATREVIDAEGWLHTGDLGRFDARGNLVISGRAKEMIVLASGKNVFPAELDDHYAGHPLIGEVCVVGLPESGGGERLHAVVVPDLDEFRREGISTVDDYIRFEMETLSLELPTYQRVLNYTIWREPLPRTPTRKVKRIEVRRRLLEQPKIARVTAREFEFSAEDRALLESPPMLAVIDAGRLRDRGVDPIHPDMNFEFDLGIDSLSRAEMIAHLASRFAVDSDRMAEALTPREMAGMLDGAAESRSMAARSWDGLLDDPVVREEAEEYLRPLTGIRVGLFALGGLALKTVARSYFGLRVEGTEHLLRTKRPYILAVNHVSFGDAFLVGAALPERVRRDVFFLGFAGQLQGWLRSVAARVLRVIPVDPGRRLTRALQLGAAGLRLGRILMIFPEGERTFDGRLREFKPGTALLIRATGVPAIPVAIHGAYECWGRDRKRPRPGKVRIVFGPPIEFDTDPNEDSEAEIARITRTLQGRIGEMTNLSP